MNDDKIPAGKYAISTSTNFEGRQGLSARTLLLAGQLCARRLVTGKVTDPRTLN